jgi:hypothetical protein
MHVRLVLLADFCAEQAIPFVLGHALYLKAIHGGKNKNDKLDSFKLATLLRGAIFAQAYVYPREMRATRDLLRRRGFLVSQRAHLIGHIQNTASQYNLDPFAKKLTYAANREELQIAERFSEPAVRCAVEADLGLIDARDVEVHRVETHVLKAARIHEPQTFARLRSGSGVAPRSTAARRPGASRRQARPRRVSPVAQGRGLRRGTHVRQLTSDS